MNKAIEKRRLRRYPLEMRGEVRRIGKVEQRKVVLAEMRDISGTGVSLQLAGRLRRGTRLELDLPLLSPDPSIRVIARIVSNVVRMDENSDGRTDVGAVMESFEIVRELSLPDESTSVRKMAPGDRSQVTKRRS